jgi:PIN domain
MNDQEMSEEPAVLFLDTNSLLHYPPITQVDWPAVRQSRFVRLVLCMQVVHELDSKKDDPRLGERAGRVIKEIDTILEQDGVVAEGVSLKVFSYEIRTADFADTLSPDSMDDRIVHSVKKYLECHPGSLVAVYSEDMGMRLRCKANGLAVLKPDPATRLPSPASEQDKKHKLVLAELHELKNQLPSVELVISKIGVSKPDKGPVVFDLPPVPADRNLDAEFDHYVRDSGLQPLTDLFMGGIVAPFSAEKEALKGYNASLEKHFKEYKEWLELRATVEFAKAHAFKFSIWLFNRLIFRQVQSHPSGPHSRSLTTISCRPWSIHV